MLKLIRFFLIVPTLLGLSALFFSSYSTSGGAYLLPYSAKPYVMMGLVLGVVVLGLRGVLYIADPFMRDAANEVFSKLPSNAQVIPVYRDGSYYFEGQPTTASNMMAMCPDVKTLKAYASRVPINKAQPIFPRVRYTNKTVTLNDYGEPTYMVDGRVIGFRYFLRDAEGDLHSMYYPAQWKNGRHKSNRVPSATNSSGIYAAYKDDSPALGPYDHAPVKAMIAGEGEVVFGDQMMRVEEAEVIQILDEKPLKPGEKPLKFHKDRMKGRH